MNKIVILLFLVFSQKVLAFSFESDTNDKILIYQFYDGAVLNKKIYAYENKELRGNPSFIIDIEKIIIDNKSLSFKDLVSCKKSVASIARCSSFNESIDFLKVKQDDVLLTVEEKNNDLFIVNNKNKNYYLKLTVHDFKNNDWPERSSWKIISGVKAKVELNKMIERDFSLRESLNSLKSCTLKKSVKCFSDSETMQKQLEVNFKNRYIADKPELCNKSLILWDVDYEEEMKNFLKNNIVKDSQETWKNLEELLRFKNDSVVVNLTTTKFQEVDKIYLELKKNRKLNCENSVELELVIEKLLNNVTGKMEWKLNYFSAYSRKSIDEK